jgi:hypothetical protein
MISVEKMSLIPLILLFIGYLAGHIWLGIKVKHLEDTIKEKPGNEENEKLLKNFKLCFKFFPMAYVILTIVILLSL